MSRRSEQDTRRRSRKKKRGGFTTFLGVLLILVAAGLLLLDPLKNYLITQRTEAITVSNLTRDQILENQQREVTYDFDAVSYIDPMTVITDGVNPNDLPIIGGISIPELGMNLPINLGTSNEGMYYGAGTLYPDQEMGISNYSLASHHSSNPDLLFAPLLRAEEGQLMYLTDLENIYVYKIDNIVVVDPSAIEVTYPTEEPTVTLVTCTYDLQDRVIVQGTLIEERVIDEASAEMMEAFELEQNTAA